MSGQIIVESHPYSISVKIPQFDCDAAGRLKLSAALRYIQQASTGHLDSLGLTHSLLYNENIIFVLVSLALKAHRLPSAREEIEIRTCPAAQNGVQMIRETLIVSPEGELLIECQAAWAMIDPFTRRLLKPSCFKYQLPQLREWHPFQDPSKVRLSEAKNEVCLWPVRYSHLDLNGHLNNTVYADIVMDSLPIETALGQIVSELRLRYKKEVKYGDVLSLRADSHEKEWTVTGYNGEDLCFEALVSFV